MKTYKYKVTWNDGSQTIEEIEAEGILDGHVRLYFKYWKIPHTSCYIK